MKKVLGIGGSPRKGGNTDIVLRQILRGAESAGIATEEVHLRDYRFDSCIGCERCRKDKTCTGVMDAMQLLYPKILESTGLVIISPIYNHSVTAPVKAFIDRMYCFYDFSEERPGSWSSRLAGQGRKAVVGAIGEQPTVKGSGMDLTLELMRTAISDLGYEVFGELPVLGVFQKGKVKERKDCMEEAEKLGSALGKEL